MKNLPAWIIVLALLPLYSGCDRHRIFPIWDPPPSRRIILGGTYSDVDLYAPYSFHVDVHASAGQEDRPGHYQEPAIKYEVNFDDGGGWVDYTTEMLEYVRHERSEADLPVHVFADPGTYHAQARVTYWDGAVLYSSASTPPIVVLPPAGGGS